MSTFPVPVKQSKILTPHVVKSPSSKRSRLLNRPFWIRLAVTLLPRVSPVSPCLLLLANALNVTYLLR